MNYTKLRCPICNAKIVGGKCPYCKITDEQIMYASNRKAKKEVNRKKVYNSPQKPMDVKKADMVTFTILYGLLGVHSFYVGKRGRGIYQLISSLLFFIIATMSIVFQSLNYANNVFELFVDIFAINFGVNIIMWTLDIFRVCFNKYAYPVVLPKVEDIEIAKAELIIIEEQLNHKNDKYKKPFIKLKETFDKLKNKNKSKDDNNLSINNNILTENKINNGLEKTETNGKVNEKRQIKNKKK